MKKKCRPELLAPAGGMKELKAAVSSGADAVYLGGRLFNARMNAGNFDDKEIEEAVKYAHLRGVKIYVTMNTLLFDDELEAALRYASRLYEIGVDALIIQDLGLGHLIKKYIPDFELHLSTQGTVYNASGAGTAIALGYKRVVASREMSLAEIREMATVCDTEVFVHGAICMCYSGQCQLSRSIGGRSGNRGECAQPCRLLYEDENGRKGYWLSPKDLCLIHRLGDLVDARVCSFKIEGRMKSPEYVAVVTSIYRKYIDEYMDATDKIYNKEEKYHVRAEDVQALMQIFSRGRFTEGYIDGQPESFLSGDLPKHQGILIGHVLGRGHHDLVRVQLNDRLELGDGVEIRGGAPGERKPVGNIVTYIEDLTHDKGSSGTYPRETMIGDIKGDVRAGDLVYRISDKSQLEAARAIVEGDLKKIPVNMKFFAMPGKKAKLTVNCDDAVVAWAESDVIIEPAKSRPVDEEFVRDKLTKTGDTVYVAGRMNIKLAGDCHISASVINQMRRSALEELDEKRMAVERERVILPDDPESEIKSLIDIHDICNGTFRLGEETYDADGKSFSDKAKWIRLPEITKGITDELIKSQLENDIYKGKKVVVNNPGWIQELKETGAFVYGGRGLNVTNRAAAAALAEIGVKVCEVSKELEDDPDRLMITEYDLPQRALKDSRGRTMQVVKVDGKTLITK